MIPGSKIGSIRYNGPSDNALADKGVYVIAANQSTGIINLIVFCGSSADNSTI